MSRVHSDVYKKILQERIIDIGRCELCGCKRGLQLHHIIPCVCGGKDSENNLILVCDTCHSKLTPTSELTKIGMKRVSTRNYLALDFYKYFNDFIEESASVPEFTDVCDFIDNYDFEELVAKIQWRDVKRG